MTAPAPQRIEKRRRLLPMLAALLAVAVQAFAVQSHVHAYTPLVGAYETSVAVRAPAAIAAPNQSGDHTVCILCGVLTSGRAALLPTAAAIHRPPGDAVQTAAFAIREPPEISAHAWRSRAPPSDL